MKGKMFTLAILLSGCVVLAVGQQSDKKTALIRAEVETIDRNLPMYQRTLKEPEGVSRRAEAEYFTSKDDLKKIIARVLGDTGRSDNEYYYRDNKLMFAIHRWTKYDGSISKGAVKVSKVVETIAYFDAGECFFLLVDKKSVGPDTPEWKEQLFSVEATSSIFRKHM